MTQPEPDDRPDMDLPMPPWPRGPRAARRAAA
jgi:hypothetical protein